MPFVPASPRFPLGIPNELFQSLNMLLLLVRTLVRLYARRNSFNLPELIFHKSEACMFWLNVLESALPFWKNWFTFVELSPIASRIEYRTKMRSLSVRLKSRRPSPWCAVCELLLRKSRLLLSPETLGAPNICAAFIALAAESQRFCGMMLPGNGVAPVTFPCESKVRVAGS